MTKKTEAAKRPSVIKVNEEPEIQLDAGSPELMREIEAWVKQRGGEYDETVTEPATYWDTHNFRLLREAIEYRVKGSGPFRHDMKTPVDTANRAVVRDAHDVLWRKEIKYTSDKPQPPALSHFFGIAILKPVAKRVREFFGRTLEMKCDAMFSKAKYNIKSGAGGDKSKIEYSFQTGNMFALDHAVKSRDLYIIELERRKGPIEALHCEYEALMAEFGGRGLKILPVRKVFIGFELLLPIMDDKQKKCFREALALNTHGSIADPVADAPAVKPSRAA